MIRNETDRLDVAKLTEDLIHKCNESLFLCTVGFHFSADMEVGPCCDSNLIRRVYTIYGPCHQISWPAGQNTQQIPGPTWGMNILGQVPVADSAPIRRNSLLSSGFYLLIQPEKNNPMPSQAIAIPPGSHTQIGLKVQKRRLIPPRFVLFEPPCRRNASLHYLLGKFQTIL